MAEKGLITKSTLTNIAAAIRSKNGATATYKPADMPAAIKAIETGPSMPDGVIYFGYCEPKEVTFNGTDEEGRPLNTTVQVPVFALQPFKDLTMNNYSAISTFFNRVSTGEIYPVFAISPYAAFQRIQMQQMIAGSVQIFFKSQYNFSNIVCGQEYGDRTRLYVPSGALEYYQNTTFFTSVVFGKNNIVAYDT